MLLEGVAIPFRGARRGGRTGAGSTVLRNDIGHSAQHPHSAGDGRTVAGCQHNAGA
jgi:hypothetical protein